MSQIDHAKQFDEGYIVEDPTTGSVPYMDADAWDDSVILEV